MDMPTARHLNKTVDSVQQRLASYAYGLNYASLTPEAIHAAKVRIIDTLGAMIGGLFFEPCRIARDLAAQMPDPGGATVLGTRMKTMPDMAAFVNGTAARAPEIIDSYHGPGSAHGHASEVVAPVLAAAEYAQASGRDFITAIVLAYEIFVRISDVFHNKNAFDTTNLTCVGCATAAGKLLGLSSEQLSHCISMAVVPNIVLHQVTMNYKTMFKPVSAGHAGRAGVFAALLARAGMEGPHLPYEGKAGWCDHVAKKRFSFDTMGGNGTPFKISETQIKMRPAAGGAVGCILAAEKVAPLNIKEVKQVTVEVSRHAKRQGGTSEYCWNPDSMETADHSIPYVVATALKDGTVTLHSYSNARLWNPDLRALIQKIEVSENEEFTQAMERLPVEHRTRVTVVTDSGQRLVGESGGDKDGLAGPKSDAQIEEKFRGLTEDYLGSKRVDAILECLWHLEDLKNVAEIPPDLVLA